MNALLRLTPATCALSLALALPAVAYDGDYDWCEYTPNGGSSCATNRHKHFYPDGSGPKHLCPFGAVCVLTFKADMTPAVGPDPVMLLCTQASPESSWCEGWPKGEFSYHWTGSSAVTLGPIYGDGSGREVHCNWPTGSHVVSVTVTAPNGLAGTAHSMVYCNGVMP